MTFNMEGRMVRVSLPDGGSEEGVVIRYYPVTEQCLVEFPASKGISWIADECLEVTG